MQPYNGNGQAVIVIHIAIGQYTSMCISICMQYMQYVQYTQYVYQYVHNTEVILDRIHTDKPVMNDTGQTEEF